MPFLTSLEANVSESYNVYIYLVIHTEFSTAIKDLIAEFKESIDKSLKRIMSHQDKKVQKKF